MLFKDYLRHRSQCACLINLTSFGFGWCTTSPQGSILGPLLHYFLLYLLMIYHVSCLPLHGSPVSYADNNILHFCKLPNNDNMDVFDLGLNTVESLKYL